MGKDRILEIYQMVISQQEFYNLALENNYDISWLKSKLEEDEYIRLENEILDYGNKNDEILFRAGFQYAWDLFQQCCRE